MPSVEELLNQDSEEVEAYTDTGIEYCIVDDDTRLVTIPEKYKKLGVESDEKAKRIWFRFPKLVGNNGVDLSAIGVRVNFRNANGERDIYIVEDLTTDGDYVTFSWELTKKVTAYKGNVSFVVCAVKSDTDGTIKNEWNTTLNKECEVLEGLEVTEQIEQENPDIIEYILANLGGIAFDYITIEVDDEEIPCTALSLNNTSLTFNGSGQQTLVATPTPIDTTDSITWASSNKSVATVSNGVVTSIGNGSCTITATCGTIKATCTVNVSGITTTIPVTGVTLDQTTASVDVDSTIILVSTIQPTNASNQNVSWTSDNETVAKVVNGVVTGISGGTASIGVMTEDGGYSATCNVTVNEVVTYRNLFDKDTMVTSNQGLTGAGVIGNYNWGLARVHVKENTQYSYKPIEDGGLASYYLGASAGGIGFEDSSNNLLSYLSFGGSQSDVEAEKNGVNAHIIDYLTGEVFGGTSTPITDGIAGASIVNGWVTFTTPSNCAYLLFNTTLKNNADKIQVEEGDTIHDYYLPYEGSGA